MSSPGFRVVYFRFKCLSEGNIINFDEPFKLLLDESSILHQLYKNLSPTEKRMIFETASKGRNISPDDIAGKAFESDSGRSSA